MFVAGRCGRVVCNSTPKLLAYFALFWRLAFEGRMSPAWHFSDMAISKDVRFSPTTDIRRSDPLLWKGDVRFVRIHQPNYCKAPTAIAYWIWNVLILGNIKWRKPIWMS